ncbi:MAG: glycosyltransferase [Anaerolineales bacterium]|jgi:glycosyltransferase involved in cell wall biosynthesis
MRILFLSAWFPFPADNGSKLRIYNLISGLSSKHEISLLSFADDPRMAQVDGLQDICESVQVLPNRKYDAYSRRAILGFFGTKPRVLADRYVPEMEQAIRKEVSSGSYDLVIASQFYMADYLKGFARIPAIFEEAEVGVFTDAAEQADHWLRQTRNKLTLFKLRSYFRTLLPNFSFSTVVSETEKKYLANLVPNYQSIEVIPNGVNLASYENVQEQPQPGSMIFSGALTFAPNYHAMKWFTEQVFPLVLKANPEAQLTITGDHAGLGLANDRNVIFAGYVDDIRPLIASSWISLVPILSGGGTRLKILEAFGLQTPVVATSKGAQGLEVRHEKHLLIADTVESFAEQTIRLLNDSELRYELVSNALQLVRERYDWDVIMPKFHSIIASAV